MTGKVWSVLILPENKVIRAGQGENLSDLLRDAGVPLSAYCQKRGLCGKCFVEIVEGHVPSCDAREKTLLEHKGLSPGHRLACRYEVNGDLTVRIPEVSLVKAALILETGLQSPVAIDPAVKKYALDVAKPSLDSPFSLFDAVRLSSKHKDLPVTLHALRSLALSGESKQGQATAVLYGGEDVLSVEAGDTTKSSFGIGVDIGTSTVVAGLVDLNSGESLSRSSSMNSQIAYGPDVVSRIGFAFQDPDRLRRIRDAIVGQVNGMIVELAERAGRPLDRVYDVVIAGNTAMNHLFLGVPVNTLALAPFHAVFSSLPPLRADEIGLSAVPSAMVYVAPNIKSFVGGDISAGLAATDFAHAKGNHLFIDLGTNGEIVLKQGRRVYATSTAAGPAFEGMTISCGMLALPGAICRAEWQDRIVAETIGGRKPKGVCGTGLIDLLSVCLKQGFVAADGRIAGGEKKIQVTEGIFLTQQDIREMQLAVAAIKTGVRMMTEKFRLSVSDLDGILIAGAFGNFLDIGNSMSIGLLPCVPRDKIVFVGNASLSGAKKLLLSGPERQTLEAWVGRIEHLSLATAPEFQDNFIAALEFKPYPEEECHG